MTNKDFTELVDKQFKLCKDTLCNRRNKYSRDDDVLHNFYRASDIRDKPVLETIQGMWIKQFTAFMDYHDQTVTGEKEFKLEEWDELITDLINYYVLTKAIIIDLELYEKVSK